MFVDANKSNASNHDINFIRSFMYMSAVLRAHFQHTRCYVENLAHAQTHNIRFHSQPTIRHVLTQSIFFFLFLEFAIL